MKKIISLMSVLVMVFSLCSFTVNAESKYDITLRYGTTNLITVTSDKETANAGETVTFNATVTDGYLLPTIKVTWTEDGKTKEEVLKSENDLEWTFVMPDSDITVYAKPELDWRGKETELKIKGSGLLYGEIYSNKYTVKYGDTITLTAIPKEGCEVEYLLVNDIEIFPSADSKYRFTVDSKEVLVFVKFRKSDSNLYKIDIDTAIGAVVSVDKLRANAGDKVTVTVRPDPGKDNIIVKYNSIEISGNGKVYTFTMPNRRVSVEVICSKETATWEKVAGQWKLKSADGKYITGWYKLNNIWYYLDTSGMKTGWIKPDNNWYYLKSNGAMAEGEWLKSNGNWYYLKNDGTMVTGWFLVKNKWYFFNADGKMLSSTVIDGCRLDANGAWVK